MKKLADFIQWAEQYTKTHKKYNIEAQFLELKDELAQYIDQGFTIKLLYVYLKESKKLNCTYETFRRLVHKHLKNKKKEEELLTPSYATI